MGRNNNNKIPRFEEQGILLVDKPSEWTSFDVVNFVRSRFNMPKIGHCGTLDPAATGLLVLVIGKKYTTQSQTLSGEDKVYQAELLLGTETDSQDMDGTITSEKDYSDVTEEKLRETISSFVGEQEQIPPMVSAKKKNGKRLYELARKGIEIERDPVKINIHYIEIDNISIPTATFETKCSKGTYIRTLCYDIGKNLECGGVLKSLRRTQSGDFKVADAITIEQIKEFTPEDLKGRLLK